MTPQEEKVKKKPTKSTEGPQCPIPFEIKPELLNILQTQFKLTELQSRAYIALLAMGQLAPEELALYSGVPSANIKTVIDALLKKQLIKPLPGVVVRYRAFAPYKELAEEVRAFTTETENIWKDLQKLQNTTIDYIRDELRIMNRRLQGALETLSERQGIALSEAAMMTNIVLNNVAENVQKSLTNLSSSSREEFSEHTTQIKNSLEESVESGFKQLDEAHKLTLEKAHEAISFQKETSEQWLTTVTDQLLQGMDKLSNQIKTQLDNTRTDVLRSTDIRISQVTSDANSLKEEINESNEEALSTFSSEIETLRDEVQQAINSWHKSQTQTLTKILQEIKQQIRNNWTQRLEILDDIILKVNNAFKKENRRLTRLTDRTAPKIDKTIANTRQTSTQISETLFQELRNALVAASQEYKRLHKEVENTVSQWPPSALTFTQFSKIQISLTNLMEQTKTEYGRLLETTTETLGVEMRDAYLTPLLEVRKLLESLEKDLQAQQALIKSNFKSLTDQVGKRLNKRIGIIRKSSDFFVSEFQDRIQLLQEQKRTLAKRSQSLINQHGTTVSNTLEVTKDKIHQYIEDQLTKAETKVKKAREVSTGKAAKSQKKVDKQLRTFNAALKKLTKETNTALQHEFSQLEGIVKEYSSSVETTADKLREEQLLRVKAAIGSYKPALRKRQSKRNRKISAIFRSTQSQLIQRDTELVNSLKEPLHEAITQYSSKALDTYQAAIKDQAPILEEEAITSFNNILQELSTKDLPNTINQSIINAIKEESERLLTEFQTNSKEHQLNLGKQTKNIIERTHQEGTKIHNTQMESLNDLISKSFTSQVTQTLQDCKTKIGRQTKRHKQIEKIYLQTLERIKQTQQTVLPKLSKSDRDKLTTQLEEVLSQFMEKLQVQINREIQIKKIFQITQDTLLEFPQEVLPKITRQHSASYTTELSSAFNECQSLLDQHQKDFTKQIIVNAQSQLEKLYQHDYKNQLEKPLSASIIKYATTALTGYRDTIAEQQLTLEEEAVGTYQITFDKFLQRKLADLNKFTPEEKPILKEILTTTVRKITDAVQQYDTDQRALVDKYWLPITKIVEEYSTTTIGNLNAIKTAIGSILDQVSLNVTTSLTNFKDDGGNLLNVTTQAFDREKAILNEQVTQGLTKMQEACLIQLQDTRKLLELLGEDMTIQQITLDADKEAMISEIEESTIRNLSTIQETADAFTKDLQSKVQSIEEQIQEEIKKTQELIIQQGTNLADSLIPIQGQLSDFSKNQIQPTQEIIEDISSTTTLKIDDFRKAIEKQLETFALMLTEETEDYVSTLRQEIVQLQTVATNLNEKIKNIGEAIETKLVEQIEGSIVNLHAAIEEQQNTLSKEISTMFQTFTDQFGKIQGELQQSLTLESQAGHETLDQSFGQLSNLLDEKTAQLSLQNEKAEKTQLDLLERRLESQKTIVQETLSNVYTMSNNNLDQFTKMVTELLTLHQRELVKATTASLEALEREITKYRSNMGKEVEQMFQNQGKELNLAKTRITRVTGDWLRSSTEILQNFKESALTDIQQKSDAITLSFKQMVDTAEEGIITQTKQSGQRIGQNLGKERQTLKTEYQTLTKEITAKAKETETISLNALQGFTEKTDPIIKRLQIQTQDTKNILIGIWDSLSDLRPSETERTWRIVTCEGIQNHLLFMFRRVKDTITLVYPHFDEIPVNELSRISPETRVHVITKLDGERQRTAALKLLKQGNIRIWNNPQMDFYGGSRDGEEVLIAPIHDDRGEIVAIVSDQESYISLFNQTLGPRWISTSREIRPGS